MTKLHSVLYRFILPALVGLHLVGPVNAFSEKLIPMRVYFVIVDDALPDEKLLELILFQRRKYLEIGIDMKIKQLFKIKDPAPQTNSLYTRLQQLRIAGQISRELGIARPRRVVHYIYPPMLEGYFAGYASGTCTYHTRRNTAFNTSVSNGALVNKFGVDRFTHSEYAVTHEIGHIVGAGHVQTPSIMNTNLLALVSAGVDTIPWDPKSKKDIRRCLGAKSRKAALGTI